MEIKRRIGYVKHHAEVADVNIASAKEELTGLAQFVATDLNASMDILRCAEVVMHIVAVAMDGIEKNDPSRLSNPGILKDQSKCFTSVRKSLEGLGAMMRLADGT